MSIEKQPPHPAASLERVSALVSDLEQELSLVSIDSLKLKALKDEITTLKSTLQAADMPSEGWQLQLKSTHSRLDDFIASIEGEALKDTPYLTEMARILGLV